MNGFRDSYQSIKKSSEITKNKMKEELEEEIVNEQNEKEEEQKSEKSGDSLFRLLQLQLSVCLIFFLLVMGIKAINSTFYTSVRAGTFEKSYRLTNLWDINSKLDNIAGRSRLLSFILGRSNTPAAKDTPAGSNQSDKTAGINSSDTGSGGSDGSRITDDTVETDQTVSVFGSSTSTNVLDSFASGRTIIPTIDESALSAHDEEDDSKASSPEVSTSSANTQQPVKIPECDNDVHIINGSYYNPVKSYITSNFGIRTDPISKKQSFHTGVDIGVKKGTKVISPMKGTVSKTGYSSVWGNYILVNHEDGFETFYAHLSSVKVKKGASVKAQTVLALSGNTGRSTGPHLHFEIHFNGKYQNPLFYFDFK